MAYEDEFARLMTEQGVPIDPASVPTQDVLLQELERANGWFWLLDAAVREGFDEGSTEYAVCYLLGDPELSVAPSIPALWQAFDSVSGRSFSQLLATAQDCATRASDGVG